MYNRFNYCRHSSGQVSFVCRKQHGFRMYRYVVLFVASLSLCLIPITTATYGRQPRTSEYEVKAAYLYNFLLFIKWPELEDTPPTDSKTPETITIGIVGKNVFGAHFNKVEGKLLTNKNKKLVIKHFGDFHNKLDVTDCQLLFVASSEKNNLKSILARVNGKPILTVSDITGFLEIGGMINFISVQEGIRFEINQSRARDCGLRPNSHLLQSASRVVREPRLPD